MFGATITTVAEGRFKGSAGRTERAENPTGLK